MIKEIKTEKFEGLELLDSAINAIDELKQDEALIFILDRFR